MKTLYGFLLVLLCADSLAQTFIGDLIIDEDKLYGWRSLAKPP